MVRGRRRARARSGWWRAGGLLVAAALLGATWAIGGDRVSAEERVHVFYPRGECETGVIEIEVYDRTSASWQRHATHWRVPADTCQAERAGVLLQEIRYRCVDPASPSRASAWTVGVDVYEGVSADRCAAKGAKD